MSKKTLSEWASLAEIIGTVAVVASLLFIGYSVNRNTEAMYASSDNIIFERHSELSTQFMFDESLAGIMAKVRRSDEALTEVEAIRWERYIMNLLDVWATAHDRYHRHFRLELSFGPTVDKQLSAGICELQRFFAAKVDYSISTIIGKF